MEDERIIELYWRRDERAIAETDGKYGAYCRAVSMNILGVREDAEECVNDTYVHAWNAMPPQRPTHLRLWLAKLSDADRVIFMRRYWCAEGTDSIAESYGVSANTLTKRLSRMRASLKRHLEMEGITV